MKFTTLSPSSLGGSVLGEHTLTWGELLGFIAFFLIVIFHPFGSYSVWIAIALLFITVTVY